MKFGQYLCLFIISICVGLLAGLSISPVIQTIISLILAVIISTVSILAGTNIEWEKLLFKEHSKIKFDILPLTILIIGITAGALGGIYMRTHDVLGNQPNLSAETESKKEHSQSKQEKAPDETDNAVKKAHLTALFDNLNESKPLKQDICSTIAQFDGKQLIQMLHQIGNAPLDSLIDSCKSNPDLYFTRGKLVNLFYQRIGISAIVKISGRIDIFG